MFLNVITSTHSLTKVFLPYNRHISILFNTSIGLKQGDMFSPLFFNLCINDVPLLLQTQNGRSEESATPKLLDARISSLLFADDLATFYLI